MLLFEAIKCGGDTETVVAIVGAITGAGVGVKGIPERWLETIVDYPFSVGYIKKLTSELSKPEKERAKKHFRVPVLLLLVRNFIFIPVVFAHIIRRAFPPY